VAASYGNGFFLNFVRLSLAIIFNQETFINV
jgi:hypothetical protein